MLSGGFYQINVGGGLHSPVIREKAVSLHRDPAYHFEKYVFNEKAKRTSKCKICR